MSVRKLVIHTKDNVDTIELEMIEDARPYLLTINGQSTSLDRASADMIRLWLQEHLK